MVALTPRYIPSWTAHIGSAPKEEFLGHVGELDAYYQDHRIEGGSEVAYIVGPSSRLIKRGSPHNFDAYRIEDGALELHDNIDTQDLHLDLHDMCLLYQLLEDKGFMHKEKET